MQQVTQSRRRDKSSDDGRRNQRSGRHPIANCSVMGNCKLAPAARYAPLLAQRPQQRLMRRASTVRRPERAVIYRFEWDWLKTWL